MIQNTVYMQLTSDARADCSQVLVSYSQNKMKSNFKFIPRVSQMPYLKAPFIIVFQSYVFSGVVLA